MYLNKVSVLKYYVNVVQLYLSAVMPDIWVIYFWKRRKRKCILDPNTVCVSNNQARETNGTYTAILNLYINLFMC